MTDMIVRVAKALRSHRYGKRWDDAPFNPEEDSGDASWLSAAKAALSALEEPSESMIQAGAPIHFHRLEGLEKSIAIFTAMIRSAKGEAET